MPAHIPVMIVAVLIVTYYAARKWSAKLAKSPVAVFEDIPEDVSVNS